MKAISLYPLWAQAISFGIKQIECRKWKTDYRGELLICANAQKDSGSIDSHAICVVTLEDVVPFTKECLEYAFMEEMPEQGSYAWILSNIRLIKPFPVKGQQRLFNVDDSLIEYPQEQDYKEILKKYYYPLVYFSKDDDDSRSLWEVILSGEEELVFY